MTAVLHDGDNGDMRCYPERLSVRLTPHDYHLYDALMDTAEDQSATVSHIVIALLRRWEDDPDFQHDILNEAHEISRQRRLHADVVRRRKISAAAERKRMRLADTA